MVLDCLLALPRCGVASGWSKFRSKWLNKKFVQFSSPASSRWWTVRSVRFGARRLSDSVQFVQFSSRTDPALIVTLTLAGTRYYNISTAQGELMWPPRVWLLIELKLQLKNNVLLATGRSWWYPNSRSCVSRCGQIGLSEVRFMTRKWHFQG